ncbi:hypothetical protein AB0L06_39850 [Spirillospora sp. NPDC052269]
MSSTTTVNRSQTPPTPRTVPGAARRAVIALAAVEAFRLLRHPAVLGAFALYLAPWAYEASTGDAAHRFPVLQDASWSSQPILLVVAAGTLLAANLAALRAQRHGVAALYEVLVLTKGQRTTAHLLSLLPVTVLSGAVAVGRMFYLAGKAGAVGHVQPLEVAAGPLCVLLAGVIGILLARLSTSAAVAPLALAGLGIMSFVAAVNNTASWRWLGLIAIESEIAAPLPADLAGRPAGAHALWLSALAVLLAVVALMRSGVRSLTLKATGSLALVAAVAAAGVQLGGVPASTLRARAEATRHPVKYETCSTIGNVSYCSFPDFSGWGAQWAHVAQGILSRTPPDVSTAHYFIRQRIFSGGDAGTPLPPPLSTWQQDDLAAHTPDAVTVGTDWGEGSAAGDRSSDAVIDFAAEFAFRVVTGKVPGQSRLTMLCRSPSVLVLWLAAQSTAGTQDAFMSMVRRSSGGLSLPLLGSAAGLTFNAREEALVLDLLHRPAGEVAARVRASWAELAASATSTDRAAEILGVPAPDRALAEGSRC